MEPLNPSWDCRRIDVPLRNRFAASLMVVQEALLLLLGLAQNQWLDCAIAHLFAPIFMCIKCKHWVGGSQLAAAYLHYSAVFWHQNEMMSKHLILEAELTWWNLTLPLDFFPFSFFVCFLFLFFAKKFNEHDYFCIAHSPNITCSKKHKSPLT